MVTHHYTEIDIAYIIYPIDIDIYNIDINIASTAGPPQAHRGGGGVYPPYTMRGGGVGVATLYHTYIYICYCAVPFLAGEVFTSFEPRSRHFVPKVESIRFEAPRAHLAARGLCESCPGASWKRRPCENGGGMLPGFKKHHGEGLRDRELNTVGFYKLLYVKIEKSK